MSAIDSVVNYTVYNSNNKTQGIKWNKTNIMKEVIIIERKNDQVACNLNEQELATPKCVRNGHSCR